MFKKINLSILIPYLFLSIVGLIMVYSSTSFYSMKNSKSISFMAFNQFCFWLFSLFIMFIILKIKIKILKNKYFIFGIFYLILFLLFLVKFTSFGVTINGTSGWLKIFNFSIQPVEYLKLSIILYLAYFIDKNCNNDIININNFKKKLLKPLFICIISVILVVLQPDFGNGLIVLLLIYFIILLSGINYFYAYIYNFFIFSFSFIFIKCLSFLKINFIPKKFLYIYNRFIIFSNPFLDETNKGYQLVNSFYAISNGNWFGLGLGNSIQKKGFLPEAYSDFAFSITIEELGLLGAFIILSILIFMIIKIILIGIYSNNIFNFITSISIGILFLLQIFINLGGILGLIPLTGITFPFLSHGGNSLLVNSISIAIILKISSDEKKNK